MIILINSLFKMLHIYRFYNILVYSSYKSPIIHNNTNIWKTVKLQQYLTISPKCVYEIQEESRNIYFILGTHTYTTIL